MAVRSVCFAFLLGIAVSAGAVPPLYTDSDGVVIGGYDPVAFFSENDAVSGNRRFRHEWGGGTWWFASAVNRDRFIADPERFAPQYGGHCAAAMVSGTLVKTSPIAWTVRDARLFLNYDKQVREGWLKNVAANVRAADANWAASYASQ